MKQMLLLSLLLCMSCNYYETTIINEKDCTVAANRIPINLHPVEFLWYVDEDLIYNTYDHVIQPISHSFLKPSRNGFNYTFEIIDDRYQFGKNWVLLDNCDKSWYSVHRVNNQKFELYLNNYCYDTQIDLHQILFIVDIVFY